MEMVLGVPVVRRYDLLARFLHSVTESEFKPSRLIIVDNGCQLRSSECPIPEDAEVIEPGRNVGVSGAWNYIADRCDEKELLVVSNDDIRLKPYSLGKIAVAAAAFGVIEAPSFTLFAVTGEARRIIGGFDENFFPAYFEDNDYARRITLANVPITRVMTDTEHEGSASLRCLQPSQQAKFAEQFDRNGEYFQRKWGGPPLKEKYSEPFNGQPPAGWMLRPITVGGREEKEPWLQA